MYLYQNWRNESYDGKTKDFTVWNTNTMYVPWTSSTTLGNNPASLNTLWNLERQKYDGTTLLMTIVTIVTILLFILFLKELFQ